MVAACRMHSCRTYGRDAITRVPCRTSPCWFNAGNVHHRKECHARRHCHAPATVEDSFATGAAGALRKTPGGSLCVLYERLALAISGNANSCLTHPLHVSQRVCVYRHRSMNVVSRVLPNQVQPKERTPPATGCIQTIHHEDSVMSKSSTLCL